LHLKQGTIDEKDQVLELNTAGVTSFMKLVFLCDPTDANLKDILKQVNHKKSPQKEVKKPMPVMDEESMDELDGEVAMISKRIPESKSSDGGSSDILSADDIKMVIQREENGIDAGKNNYGRPNKDLFIEDYADFTQ
jgi:hypothetical protein